MTFNTKGVDWVSSPMHLFSADCFNRLSHGYSAWCSQHTICLFMGLHTYLMCAAETAHMLNLDVK